MKSVCGLEMPDISQIILSVQCNENHSISDAVCTHMPAFVPPHTCVSLNRITEIQVCKSTGSRTTGALGSLFLPDVIPYH